jgi:SAM-dependent methyltransferase
MAGLIARFWENKVLPGFIGCACGSKPIAKQRAKVVPLATGVVVDMGFGSGTNLPYLDATKVTRVIAVEPSQAMLDHARPARRQDIAVEEVVAGAEATGLPDGIADTVLITFALCTIPDPQAALNEARRLLKPGGKLIFCEHGLAPDAKVAAFQRRIEPLWRPIAGGCHLTRNPLAMLDAAHFVCERSDAMYLPGTPHFAGYNTWGVAVPG